MYARDISTLGKFLQIANLCEAHKMCVETCVNLFNVHWTPLKVHLTGVSAVFRRLRIARRASNISLLRRESAKGGKPTYSICLVGGGERFAGVRGFASGWSGVGDSVLYFSTNTHIHAYLDMCKHLCCALTSVKTLRIIHDFFCLRFTFCKFCAFTCRIYLLFIYFLCTTTLVIVCGCECAFAYFVTVCFGISWINSNAFNNENFILLLKTERYDPKKILL